jgi:hypothetical protein
MLGSSGGVPGTFVKSYWSFVCSLLHGLRYVLGTSSISIRIFRHDVEKKFLSVINISYKRSKTSFPLFVDSFVADFYNCTGTDESKDSFEKDRGEHVLASGLSNFIAISHVVTSYCTTLQEVRSFRGS